MKAIDRFTRQPIRSPIEFELYRDLDYFIRTGKHRRPAVLRWKKLMIKQAC
jgi:hypothetical protein